jgi:hypothetical protein
MQNKQKKIEREKQLRGCEHSGVPKRQRDWLLEPALSHQFDWNARGDIGGALYNTEPFSSR